MNKIVLIGTAINDHLIYSDSIIKAGTCNKVEDYFISGGVIRNISFNLGYLEIPNTLISVWGNDIHKKNLVKELKDVGVTIKGPTINKPTPIFTSIESATQKYLISSITDDFYFNNEKTIPNKIFSNAEYLISDTDDDYLIHRILKINPQLKYIQIGSLPSKLIAPYTYGVILNRHEFSRQTGHNNYYKIYQQNNYNWLIVTLDIDGVYFCQNQKQENINTYNVNGYPLGCGDGFCSGVILKLSEGYPLTEAINYGNEIAKRIFTHRGNTLKER